MGPTAKNARKRFHRGFQQNRPQNHRYGQTIGKHPTANSRRESRMAGNHRGTFQS